MKISQQIKQQREQRHWSQADLAKRLNISRESISKWESGTALPSFTNVIKLGELFDLSLDDLIKGDDKLIHNFESHEPEPLSRLSKFVLSVAGLSIVGYLIGLALHMSASSLRDWLELPFIITLIWLLCTINWTQMNRILSKKTLIIGGLCLTFLLIPSITQSIHDMISGMWAGIMQSEKFGYLGVILIFKSILLK